MRSNKLMNLTIGAGRRSQVMASVWWSMSLRSIAVCALLLGAVSIGSANGPEVGRDAGTVFPVESIAVQLVAESVDVRFDFESNQGTARCVYYLHNLSGSRQSFEMAFVTNSPVGQYGGAQRFYRDIGMVVNVDGIDTPTRLDAVQPSSWDSLVSPAPDSLPVWTVAIAPGATARVHMDYRVWLSGGSDGHHGGMGITYRCRPASLWAGTIGKATIQFHLKGLGPYLLSSLEEEGVCFTLHPPTWTGHGGTFEWTFRDWEPDEDIGVRVSWN